MIRFTLPFALIALCLYLGYLAFQHPAVLLQHFALARNVLLCTFGMGIAFSFGVESSYRALLPFLDEFEVVQAEQAMGWLAVFDPIWFTTAAALAFVGLYSLRGLAQDARAAQSEQPRHPMKRD